MFLDRSSFRSGIRRNGACRVESRWDELVRLKLGRDTTKSCGVGNKYFARKCVFSSLSTTFTFEFNVS